MKHRRFREAEAARIFCAAVACAAAIALAFVIADVSDDRVIRRLFRSLNELGFLGYIAGFVLVAGSVCSVPVLWLGVYFGLEKILRLP